MNACSVTNDLLRDVWLQWRVGEHQSEMVGGKVVDIIEGVLGGAKQVLRIRRRHRSFDCYPQREDWLTDLLWC
jgi:hypothetical protein